MITGTSSALTRRAIYSGLVALLLVMLAAPASHAQTYTYWSLWEVQNGTWEPSQSGAAEVKLSNESVFAAKYVTSEETLTGSDAPVQSSDYKTLCPNPPSGQVGDVKVAVVVDYGGPNLTTTDQSSPKTVVSCVSVAAPATAATALSQAASVSTEPDGFITSINGYPATETATTAVEPDAEMQESEGFPIVTVVLSVAVLALIVAVAVIMIRRRNDPPA